MKHAYGFRKTIALPFETAVEKTRAALQQQGFGVISEIDLSAKLKEKLGVDYRRYLILGACNPPLAWKALQAEPEIGLLLPCNVIVYESGDGGAVVAAIDPDAMLGVVENEAMKDVASDAKQRLRAALDTL